MTYTPVPPARWIEPLTMDDEFPDSPLITEGMLVLEADTVADRAQAMIEIAQLEGRIESLMTALKNGGNQEQDFSGTRAGGSHKRQTPSGLNGKG